MKGITLASAAYLAFVSAPAAYSQVEDISKITCEEPFSGASPDDNYALSFWLSGYYNGKLNNTVWDPKAFLTNAAGVGKHCADNPKKTVMQAIETLLARPQTPAGR